MYCRATGRDVAGTCRVIAPSIKYKVDSNHVLRNYTMIVDSDKLPRNPTALRYGTDYSTQ